MEKIEDYLRKLQDKFKEIYENRGERHLDEFMVCSNISFIKGYTVLKEVCDDPAIDRKLANLHEFYGS